MILADGIVGQMMEKVVLPEQRPRRTEEEVRRQCPWAANGREGLRKRNVITSLELESSKMEEINDRLQARYEEIRKAEPRWEEIEVDEADYLIVAFGSVARICTKAAMMAREQGIKVGIVRPITLWPLPGRGGQESRRGEERDSLRGA